MKMPTKTNLTPAEHGALTEYVKHISREFPDRILAVTLFGSKARGDADIESDLDLLVVVDEESNPFRAELWRIASDISLDYNVVLSPRVFGQARWDKACQMRLPLYRSIIKDSIPLLSENVPA